MIWIAVSALVLLVVGVDGVLAFVYVRAMRRERRR